MDSCLLMFIIVHCEQSFLLGSHSSLRTDSLGLELSGTAHSGVGGLGTGREENINFLSDLSDNDDDGGPQVSDSTNIAQFVC